LNFILTEDKEEVASMYVLLVCVDVEKNALTSVAPEILEGWLQANGTKEEPV